MNKRIGPFHLRGLPVGRSYHSGGLVDGATDKLAGELLTPTEQLQPHDKYRIGVPTFPSGSEFNFDVKTKGLGEQVRSYDETEGVGALLRRHFAEELKRIEISAKQPNDILADLHFEPSSQSTYHYERKDGPGGVVTGRMSHLHPNPPAIPRQPHNEEMVRNFMRFIKESGSAPMPQTTAPKSEEPQRDVNALVAALDAGRDQLDAKLIAELACQPGSSVETLLNIPFDGLIKRVCEWRKQKSEFEAKQKAYEASRKEEREQEAHLQTLLAPFDAYSTVVPGVELPAGPYSESAMLSAFQAGRTTEDAQAISELFAGRTALSLDHMLTMDSDKLKRAVGKTRIARRKMHDAIRAKDAAEPRDSCSIAAPGKHLPKIKISVYIDNGVVFDYDVETATSAREHVSAIINTGYRHSDSATPDELTHFPPHRILKVKMRGPGITTMYYDRPRGT